MQYSKIFKSNPARPRPDYTKALLGETCLFGYSMLSDVSLDIFYACRRCCRRMSLSRMPFGLHNKPARCPSNRHNLYPQNILTFKPRAASRLNLGKILPNRFLRSDSILILWSDSLKWTKKPGAGKNSFLFTSHTESVFS